MTNQGNFIRILNIWNNQTSENSYIQGGKPGLGIGPAQAFGRADQWKIITADNGWVRIQNRENSENYLHNQNGQLEVGPIHFNWIGAMWKIIPIGSGNNRIESRKNPEHFLHNQSDQWNKVEVGPIQTNWNSAMWKLETVTSTIDQYFQHIQNIWNKVYIQGGNAGIGVGATLSNAKADQWIITPVDSGWVRIQNRQLLVNYLHNQNGQLEVGPIQDDWMSAMWKIIPIGGGQFRIQSRQNPDHFISNQSNSWDNVEVGPIQTNWTSALWKLESGDPIIVEKSYLVVQNLLMEDYNHYLDKAPEEVTNHRVVITARDHLGLSIFESKLKIHLHQVDFAAPPQDVSVQVMDANGIREVTIGENAPIEVVTNVDGQVSFGVKASNSIIAPVFHVHADFMPSDDHGLLVFPDRHALHLLANMDDNALNGDWGDKSTRKRDPIQQGMDPQKVSHVTKAVKSIMKTVNDASIFDGQPTVRKSDEFLLADVVSSNSHDHENTIVTSKFFNPISDVAAGHSVSNRDPIVRVVVPNQMKNWSLGTGNNGNEPFAYREDIDLSPILASDIQSGDPLSLALWNAHHNAAPISSSDIKNHASRTRNLSSVFDTISDAAQIVVHTVETTLSDTGQKVKTAMLLIVHDPTRATVVALDTLENAAYAAVGLLKKAGIEIGTLLHFIRDLFHWDDIKITYDLMDKNLKAVLPFVRGNLISINKALDNSIEEHKASAIESLSSKIHNLEGINTKIQESEAQTKNAPPKDIRSSYMHHLISCNAARATTTNNMGHIETQTSVYEDLVQGIDRLEGAPQNVLQELSDMMLKIFKTENFVFNEIKIELFTALSNVMEKSFDMLEAGADALFGALESLLLDWETHLSYEIEIPYVTKFYEHKMGGNMDVYGLTCLAAAIPTTILGKLALGTSDGPFKTSDLETAGRFFWPYDEAGKHINTRNVDDDPVYPIATDHAFGGLFASIMLVYNTLDSLEKKAKLVKKGSKTLKGITNTFELLFQFSQIPIFRMWEDVHLLDAVNPHHRSGKMEISIWSIQFIPFIFKGIAYGVNRKGKGESLIKLPKLGNIPCKDIFEGLATSVYGGVHLGLFIALLVIELEEQGTLSSDQLKKEKNDRGAKFFGNLCSCLPEISSVFYNGLVFIEEEDLELDSKLLLFLGTSGVLTFDKLCNFVWFVFSTVRYGKSFELHYDPI